MELKYRPEIDGLRAVAVCAVIFYHAQITILDHQPFKGGFIGVDIFFVISGYLITKIILYELVTTGSFSFKYFYERRIRRILPALLFVIIASLPFAWTHLLPSSFIDFSKSILASIGFSSNLYFYYSGQGYAADDGLLKPFLHTWSLSVEEQYYIFFPIVLIITFRYFRKYLIYTLILGLIISLALADWGSKNHPSINFYILPTRVWELLAGSILAFFEITNRKRSKYKILNLILPSIGIILIGHSIFFFNDKMFHPSFYTLSPIIGVCLVIWFSSKNEPITKILSTRLFVGIGLISYSLYLWHYPIFAFARISYQLNDNIIFKLILILVTIFLSLISYFFIERPARKKKIKFIRVLFYLFCAMILLIIVNVSSLLNKGFPSRLPDGVIELLKKDLTFRHLITNSKNEKCRNHENGCSFNINSKKKIFIVGDSHMESLAYDLKERVTSKSYQFNTSIITGCMFAPGFNSVEIKTQKINNCNDKYFSNLIKKLQKEKNSIIIFGARYPVYLNNTLFNNQEGGIEGSNYSRQLLPINDGDSIEENFKSAIEKISINNYIILVYPIPEVGWHLPRKILNQIRKDMSFNNNYKFKKITTSYEVYKKRTKSSFELLDNVEGNNIFRVYPHKLFCNTIIKARCLTHDDKNIFYVDSDHPSLKGSELINNLIMKELAKIELISQ